MNCYNPPNKPAVVQRRQSGKDFIEGLEFLGFVHCCMFI